MKYSLQNNKVGLVLKCKTFPDDTMTVSFDKRSKDGCNIHIEDIVYEGDNLEASLRLDKESAQKLVNFLQETILKED